MPLVIFEICGGRNEEQRDHPRKACGDGESDVRDGYEVYNGDREDSPDGVDRRGFHCGFR